MGVFLNSESLQSFKKAVLTIGTFDGVHLGHRAILKEVVRHAKSSGGESVLVTFEPHPRKIIFPEEHLSLLTPLNEKIKYLQETGIDHIVVQPFTSQFARLSAASYIEDFLVNRFHPHSIVIGYDHHFGADRRGNIELLDAFANKFNYIVHQIPAEMISNAAISSTKIRQALEMGDVSAAKDMLGRYYNLVGIVVKGAQIGRTIGFPTANLVPADSDQLIPGRGVYAIKGEIEGKEYDGMLNIGYRPTISQEIKLHIEAHLFSFNEDIYEKSVSISFIERLRNEEKFPSLEALKGQLAKDAENAKQALQKHSA